jgi:hypothetical protein
MRAIACALALLVSASAWGQTPQAPPPNPKSTPQAQPPTQQTQLYRLVPVEQPQQTTTQQYQTVQLVQQPTQYQTVQVQQQPVQQVQYVNASQSTFAVAGSGNRTVVLGPGLVGLSLARVGQAMATGFGKTHVWNIQHQVIRPQPQPSPPVQQLVTVSMPQPVVQQQYAQVQLLQQPVQQVLQPQYKINAPSEDAPPPPVVPTPQSSKIPPPKHGLFGMLGN